MKFISGIYTQTVNEEGILNIDIPHYHRAPIGLLTSTRVYCVYRKYPALNRKLIKEIILTTIHPGRWHLYRKITLISSEGPGIIHAITEALQKLDINVHIQEALTTEYDKIHSLTLIVDLHDFVKYVMAENSELEVSEKAIETIRTRLLSLKKTASKFIISSEGNLTISKLSFLANNSFISQNPKKETIAHIQFSKPASAQISKGKIQITSDILRPLDFLAGKDVSYTMFSETEERYLKMLFFNENQRVAFIDVVHRDFCGAISAFTGIIARKHRFNILASYSRQQDIGTNAHWYALIDITGKEDEFYLKMLNEINECTYGDPKYQPEYLWLVETLGNVDDETVLLYGQSKKNEDGSETKIYCRKQKLLKASIKLKIQGGKDIDYSELLKKKKVSKSEVALMELIRREIKNDREVGKKQLPWKKAVKSKVISGVIPLVIIFVLSYIFSDKIPKLINEIASKVLISVAMASLILVYLAADWVIHRFLENIRKED